MLGITNQLRLFVHPKVVSLLFLGFSAGIPILLIFSTLGLWLNEAGVNKSTITYFSWAALGYSFKFVWAPLIDRLNLPILYSWLGRRRSWLLISQLLVISAILLMASVDPVKGNDSLEILAYAAVLLGFSSATQDIVIDAYRIESAEPKLQSMLSATYIAGYRIGMLVAGAGALLIASNFGTSKEVYSYEAWQNTYQIMAMVMLVGVITTLMIKEPQYSSNNEKKSSLDQLRFFLLFIIVTISFILAYTSFGSLSGVIEDQIHSISSNKELNAFLVGIIQLCFSLLIAFISSYLLITIHFVDRQEVNRTYIDPIRDFFKRYGLHASLLILSVIGLYRISDIVMGVVANIFYQDMGFTKVEIATASKTFGLFMTILGGFLGGVFANKYGVFRILLIGAILSAMTNLLFIIIANIGNDLSWLYVAITFDNLSAGLAGAAFIAFLSSLTNIKFTAVQYAVFSSLMTLIPKVFGGYSGSIVENFGYEIFFIITTLIGLPIIFLVYKVRSYIK
jgi:PAT family beta-lactamase induction signal transducer AmpG